MENLSGTVLSIQAGMPRALGAPSFADPFGSEVLSGIVKTPVSGPVLVTRRHLAGDGQADLKNHGSLDQVLLAYAAEHYEAWDRELNRPGFSFGAFGENLTIAGQSESNVCIGDTFRAGDVVMQVSQPRMPCYKLNRRWNMADLASRVEETGRSGWYLRVLQEGTLESGMTMTLTERPCPEWTVTAASEVMYGRMRDPDAAERLAECPLLSASWRQRLGKRR